MIRRPPRTPRNYTPFPSTTLFRTLATDLDAPDEERRAVVLKIAADDSVAGATRRRLEHESAVLGRLDHPNLVRLLDRGRDRGRLYLVTPWVPGRRSEEHTSELQSLMRISYAVFCLKKKKSVHPLPTHHHNSYTTT